MIEAATVPINEAFKPLYESDRRYFLVTGGRGGLKSSSVHDFIARLTYERGHGILFTRYTMTSAVKSIIPQFAKTLKRLNMYDDFYITKDTVRNKKTGSFVYFGGIKAGSKNNTGRLKSIEGITTWVVEEGEDFNDEKTFDDIDDSIRTIEHQNRVIWIQNPTTREHFIYKRFVKDNNRQIDVHGFNVTVSNDPSVEHIHTTYHMAEDQGYLGKSWLVKCSKFKKQMQDKIQHAIVNWTKSKVELELEINNIKHSCTYYHRYIGGWLERAEGVIYTNWIEGEFDNTLPYCYALDYGYVNPLALVKIAVDEDEMKIYIKQEIYESGLDNIPARLEAIDIWKNDLIVCDTSEPRTTEAISEAGYNIEPAIKEVVKDDIRALKQYLLVVDPDSPDVKIELNNYAWNDKKAEIPIKKFDHALDATRYGYNRLVNPPESGVTLVY